MKLKIDERFKSLIPPLSSEEFDTLEKSIVEEGCRDPLVVWDGVILDGHNRYEICMRNGIIFKTVEKNFDSVDDAKIWILNNQLGRRNLNDAQRIDLVDKLFGLKERQKAKERQKSTQLKGKNSDGKPIIGGGKFSTTEDIGKSRDKLGNLAKVSGRTYDKGVKIKTEKPDLWEKCLKGELSIDKGYQELKNLKKNEERKKQSKQSENITITDKKIDLRLGDFSEVFKDLENNSIDLILTDPPYPIEYIDEWEKLGKFAKQKLKKHGFLIAYCGHKNLFESMKRLNKYLDFYWVFSLIHTGNTKLIKFNNIEAGWKPILIYQNSYKKINKKVKDVITGTGREKNNHKWQQAIDELKYLIDNFSNPNDIILDPFAGSGTTLIISRKNNRIAYGAEIDKDEYNLAKRRITNELQHQ